MLLMVGFAGPPVRWPTCCARSRRYVGERHLLWSWVPTYLMTPIVGALMAIITYIVFRAGLITGAGVATANPFGFAAIGTLVGLFSGQAAEKLKQVFETLFTATKAGGESIASAQPLSIESFAPEQGGPGEVVLVRGSGLEAAETVTFGGDAPSTAEWDEESKALRTIVPDEATDGKLSVTIESETTTSVKIFKVLRPAAGEAKDDADAQGSEIEGNATTETAKVDDAGRVGRGRRRRVGRGTEGVG